MDSIVYPSWLKTELEEVNNHIERLCHSNNETMQRMMEWILKARGKQIRPVLTLLCSKLKEKRVDATEMAAVIEVCHTASLVHDDIIDNADVRRGQLSVQKKFGKEMAVYAGDFMIFSTIRRTGLKNKPWYGMMFEKLEAMCDGEVRQFENRFNTEITEEKYIDNIVGKTSAMFSIACCAGAYEGKCNKEEIKAIEEFSKKFGIVFQLRDDLMDFITTEGISGKTTHSDFKSGYYTLPAIYTFEHSQYGDELKNIAKKIRSGNERGIFDKKIEELVCISGGLGYTINKIDYYAKEAKASLDVFQDSEVKKCLIELVEMLCINVHSLFKESL